MPMGMSGTVKDMVNVIYPLLKEQMIYWVEDWLHSSMEPENSIWKGKYSEEDESVESMESMDSHESMDSMRSMQPMRHKKPSKGSMWQKESSIQTWKMVLMEEMLQEQKKTIKELKEGIDLLWIFQIIFESLDMEKVVRHKNTQYMISEMMEPMLAMVIEQREIIIELIPGLVCVMEHCMEERGMTMDPEMKEMIVMYGERIAQALLLLAESPDLNQGINRMLMAVGDAMDMEPGQMDNFVYGVITVMKNLQERVKGWEMMHIMETISMMEQNLRAAMNEGDWTRIKMMMERVEELLRTDTFWMNLENSRRQMMQMMELTFENLYSNLQTTALTMEMIKKECVNDVNPMLCCFTVRLENGVGMLEGLGINMDYTMDMMEPWIDDMVGQMGQPLVTSVWMMVPLTEQYGMACIMEQFGMGQDMMENMKELMVQMAKGWIGEDGAPVNSINVMMDSKMKMHELVMGSCP